MSKQFLYLNLQIDKMVIEKDVIITLEIDLPAIETLISGSRG